MINDVTDRFENCSFSLKSRQILLHWSYELGESDLLFLVHIKMSYYWFKRQQLLQKEKKGYHPWGGKEKAAECYLKNRSVLKEKAINNYRDLSKREKEAKREYGKNRYINMTENVS